ncbi:MAG: TRAP transporter fused permease subunit [Halomonas sp.]|jgi:TRAP transporter 4TM/12TM fusion protein|uniref:TRAP transporter fused permease subunit n=1 Tax=Billgrantia tianxiuensis TaxID=2497861 RepID=A0A6I6SGM8_9GAMM|nr:MULTISPECIES: TRAP transporter fused permease subunit [Halomonas]MCE8035838.1 TRAP transporter fused permease subunit [Halomonas sp. MCCC 1A11057]MDX5433385.1 TRAP transporter fused permease subunit [Halomonas sp.]MDX5502989.1 TRAP transporter fused permease subunit [Halomonas sp.]QHC48692.1 TRAP transporter fused permease subunit [Halomonas tianxiuensis]
MSNSPDTHPGASEEAIDKAPESIAEGVDEEVVESNRRLFSGWQFLLLAAMAIAYSSFHLITLNAIPMETWSFRIVHIAGALILGYSFYAGCRFAGEAGTQRSPAWLAWASYALLIPAIYSLVQVFLMNQAINAGAMRIDPQVETWHYGYPLLFATIGAILLSWCYRQVREKLSPADLVLMVCALASAGYLLVMFNTPLRAATGTAFAPIGISWAALSGSLLILELTRRVAGLALVVISAIFLAYVWAGPYLPGFLGYPGLSFNRFFSQVYTDTGILGPTTAVSSTYIILFIIFAAFLQASKVGDYFVNFAFAAAGRARGGPAKVSIFASGLMGMINGTSAGNVVSTGSLTIPLMKKVGYPGRSAGAIEAAASTGGQIMPPIMGAGAFIMAEITGIPYTEIAIAALIPAILYFASVYFMVDFEAARKGMRGMRKEEIPQFRRLVKQIYLFAPIIILVAALFMGYSVIRAGTLATASAAVVSWISPNKMGPAAILKALQLAGTMSIQIIAVCACAGLIVGVISLTGVGARFSSLLLGLAGFSQLLALFFAMCISILLGMGMPTTAAYAVAASVVAPGLINIGIQPLVAHFFVFYFAVVSAITPPVALASYAAAGISGDNAMATSVTSFKIGLAAFIVPFMFFYSPAMLMEGTWLQILRVGVTATLGIVLLAATVQAWFFGPVKIWMRLVMLIGALCMIYGGIYTDIAGLAIGGALFMLQRGAHGGGAKPIASS